MHKCYEDNQGMCHNGCGRILNHDTARAYFGVEQYISQLVHRINEVETTQEQLLSTLEFMQSDRDAWRTAHTVLYRLFYSNT